MAPTTTAPQSSQPGQASGSLVHRPQVPKPQGAKPQGVKSQGAKPQGPQAPFNQAISLPVPYLCQRDSASGQGLRMCFSSTCAMAAAYLKPGCLAGGGQQDDHYLALVEHHGDSTDAAAQIQTLRGLGIQAELRTDGRIEQLIAQGTSDQDGFIQRI